MSAFQLSTVKNVFKGIIKNLQISTSCYCSVLQLMKEKYSREPLGIPKENIETS